MKVQIEFDSKIVDPVVIIRCDQMTKELDQIREVIMDTMVEVPKIAFYKDDKEYYVSVQEILFFETEENTVFAHSKEDVYKVKFRLYELEKKLPKTFIRVSKSAILNTTHIYSIDRSFTSYNLVQFYNSHKKVYVSRLYYKELKHKLDERRIL